MTDIQQPELSRLLGRALGAYGSAPLRAVEEVIFPVWVVGGFERRGLMCGFSSNIAAGGVGTFGQLRLGNPIGSKVRVFPQLLSIADPGGGNVKLRVGSSIAMPASNSFVLSRVGRSGGPSVEIARAKVDIATPAALQGQEVMAASGGLVPLTGIELIEGDVIAVQTEVANVPVSFGLFWTEEQQYALAGP